MRKSVMLAAVLLAAWGLEASPGPATAGVTKEQLDDAIAKLGANAEIWVQDKNIPTKDLADLGSLKFDKESAPAITAALVGIKRDAEGLYSTARLLEHLQASDLETIRAVMPEIERIHLQVKGLYRPFPPVSKGAEDSAGMPKYDPRMTTEAIMARMSALDSHRGGKKQRDLVIAKQNEGAWDTEQAIYRLIAVGGDLADDTKSMAAMATAERTNDGIFAVILDAYQAATAKMEPARAAKLYQILRPHALRLRMQPKKKYICKGKCQLQADTASTMVLVDDSAGAKVLALVNRLAEVAKDKGLAAVPMPTQKELDDFNKKK